MRVQGEVTDRRAQGRGLAQASAHGAAGAPAQLAVTVVADFRGGDSDDDLVWELFLSEPAPALQIGAQPGAALLAGLVECRQRGRSEQSVHGQGMPPLK